MTAGPEHARSAPDEPLPAGARRTLEHSIKDGAAHAAMLGLGEAYLAAFGIFLGIGPLALGLLAGVPLLLGSLAQLGAVRVLDRAASRRPLVVAPAWVQAAAWLPVLVLPLLFRAQAGPLLLATASLYFCAGGVIAPGWSSWIGDVVPRRIRGAFLGRREQLRIAVQLGALLAGGALLAAGRRTGHEWAGFAAAFLLAAGARLVSARHLAAMEEPPYRPPDPRHAFSFLDFLRRTPVSNFGRFTFYVALAMAATNLASPFFSLFMLRDLGFSYLEFTASSAAVLLGQVLVMRSWGRLGDRFGNRFLLKVTGLAIGFVPLPWLVWTRFEAILVWQLLGGMVWAGFNLSTASFLFDAVSPPKRARCVAYYNLILNGGLLAGAALGGWLALLLPAAPSLGGRTVMLASGLQVLFLASGLLRLAVWLVFLPFIREVRPVKRFGEVFVRVTGLSATRGLALGVFGGAVPPAGASREDPAPAGRER